LTKTIKIMLKNCSFYAYHGVFPAEKEIGQRFFVDVELDAPIAGVLDYVEVTVETSR
jgi:dihydroneopterin aldolase